jgi:eukaryotic-like serine/threonine-protein kinase
MKRDRWQKIDEIFHAALQYKPDERKTFIEEACHGDEELRRELESLLAEEKGADQFIEEPAMDVMAKDLSDEQREALTGKNIGPYRILSLLGTGGMGEVYRAEDCDLKRHVAVKVLPDRFADDRERMKRFQREAHLLASLNHPNIAAIYGLQESNGVRALVMELVEGRTLADRIAAGPILLDEALPIALQMGEALEYSHEKGVIHRDLKPANVKLTPEGTVKVLDFGLAKALEDGSTTTDQERSPTVTESGLVLGTAAYMSPEQARGMPVDKRADIWSFGVVFYEMLTGKRLYAGATTSDTLAALLKVEPDWNTLPREVPPRILRLLRRCLTKERRERLQAIGEARIEIAGYLADPHEETEQRASHLGVKQKLLLVGSTLALITASAALTWYLKQGPAPPTPLPLESRLPGDEALALKLGTYFALSPDGKRLAYIAGRLTSRHLCLRPLDRLEKEELATVDFGHFSGRELGGFREPNSHEQDTGEWRQSREAV